MYEYMRSQPVSETKEGSSDCLLTVSSAVVQPCHCSLYHMIRRNHDWAVLRLDNNTGTK